MGSKLSELSLTMLTKKKTEQAPSDLELLQIHGKEKQKHKHGIKQDDLDSSDIMAYSTINSEDKDGDSSIEQGGALMEAYQKANPKEFVNKPVVKKPEVKKPVV